MNPTKEPEEEWIKEQINKIVDRFLGWHLPKGFNPDCGISFKEDFNENTEFPMKHEPMGTSLFSATQAEEMVRYIIGDTLSQAKSQGAREALEETIAEVKKLRRYFRDMDSTVNNDTVDKVLSILQSNINKEKV